MCRNFITWCSRSWINDFIPFERHISWHKHIGYGLVPELVLHISGHISNFYRLSTKPVSEINIALGQEMRANPTLASLWLGSIPGATGLLMLLVLGECRHVPRPQVAALYAVPYSPHPNTTGAMLWGASRRRKQNGGFEKFWYSHHLFVVFYALLIVHGTSAWLEPATTHWFLLIPALLYGWQRATRCYRQAAPSKILDATHHPSNVLSLRFTKPRGVTTYMAGSYVFINVPSISPYEWHPFTLTSIPSRDYMSVHIRNAGDW
jgi:respiratory burst oxidase